MCRLFILSLLVFFSQSCTKQENDVGESCNFYYDFDSGDCVNCNGEKGYNTFDINKVRSEKRAECMKFPNMHLVYVLDTVLIDNFSEFGDNIIDSYDFRGSNLDSTRLFFNSLSQCNFSGTQLSEIEYGYAMINGKVDAYTLYPNNCPIENDSINCVQ